MTLSKSEVQHIARLARIGLTEAEEEKFQKDLAGVFDLIESLKAARIDETDGGSSERVVNRTREDAVRDSSMQAAITGSFPAQRDGYNKVKAVF